MLEAKQAKIIDHSKKEQLYNILTISTSINKLILYISGNLLIQKDNLFTPILIVDSRSLKIIGTLFKNLAIILEKIYTINEQYIICLKILLYRKKNYLGCIGEKNVVQFFRITSENPAYFTFGITSNKR